MGGKRSGPGQHVSFHGALRPASKSGAEAPAEPAPAKLHDLPVLVVDDNSTSRQILEEMIGNWRMKPVTAKDGPSAMEALRRAHKDGHPFRLVLLDAHMPGMDGFDVACAGETRSAFARHNGDSVDFGGTQEDMARAKSLGAAAALTKPAKQSDLWDTIITALHVAGTAEGASFRCAEAMPHRRHPLRILLAEDNPVNQEVAVHLIERRGHSVIVAENGRQAIEAIERHKFDLVLDGCADAGDGRPGSHQNHPRERKSQRASFADHRHDRARDAGRPRAVPGIGHGRLSGEAD